MNKIMTSNELDYYNPRLRKYSHFAFKKEPNILTFYQMIVQVL
jgi:hypothetical protein